MGVVGFYRQVFVAAVFAVLLCGSALAQSSSNNESLIPGRGRQEEQPRSVKEFLAKQRAEKEKRDHEQLLKRGTELAELTDEIELSFSKSNRLSASDRAKLESVEKLVSKIRKELGADDEDEGESESSAQSEPSTVKEAFNRLKELTADLMDELKKSTRFTISAVAIQSSNSVLKLVRFLRFKK